MPKISLSTALALLVLLVIPMSKSHAAEFEPVNVSYSVGLDSSKFGTATLGKINTTLKTTQTGYAINSVTRFQGMAAIITGDNHQESCEFNVENGKAVTEKYSGGKIGKNEYDVNFDWNERKVNFNQKQSTDMPQGYVVDNCMVWFATALTKGVSLGEEVMYIVDGSKKRIRGFKQRSSEPVSIETKLGTKDVIKLVLERELNPNKTLTFWLSPENQYLPLKIQESRKSRTTTIEIDSLELIDS